jgi:hypothetical protein
MSGDASISYLPNKKRVNILPYAEKLEKFRLKSSCDPFTEFYRSLYRIFQDITFFFIISS